jgi:exopolysaccharide biosynthesis predicted pyruvyltransferase EpsI
MAKRWLSRGRVVITDRLHGHILCLLLGLPHVLLDNSIGKLSAYFETWTPSMAGVTFASDEQTAQSCALALVTR